MNLISLVLSVLSSLPFATMPQEQRAPAEQETQTIAALRRELAEIRLLLGADRDYTKAKERLTELERALKSSADAEAEELLAEVGRIGREVRRALGEAIPAALANAGQDKVDEAVLAAIQRQDFTFVHALGKRAVPALTRVVRSEPNQFPGNTEEDPLRILALIDPLAASQLAGELIDENGFFWRKRVMRVLQMMSVKQPELWSADAPPRWLAEGFQRTAEKYAEDPDVGNDALRFLLLLVGQGQRPAALDEVVDRAIRSGDPVRRKLIRDLVDLRLVATALGAAFFERLLEESDADLREYAAWTLVQDAFRDDRRLLEHADDPSASVRRAVIECLANSDPLRWQSAEREILARLLHDPDDGVSGAAWELLVELPKIEREFAIPADDPFLDEDETVRLSLFQAPLPDDVYRGLLTVEQSARRHALADLAVRLPSSLCFELLEALAGDPSPNVLAAVLGALTMRPYYLDPSATLNVASTLLDNEATPERSRVRHFIRDMTRTRASVTVMLRWVLGRDDDGLARELLVSDSHLSWKRLASLEPDLVVACFARAFELDRVHARDFLNQNNRWTPELSQAFRALARDESRPLGLRILAAPQAIKAGPRDADFQAIARSLAAAPGWQEPQELSRSLGSFVHLVEAVQGELGNDLILRVLRDEALPEKLAISLIQRASFHAPGAAEIVQLVLARGLDKPGWRDPLEIVLTAMGNVPALQDPDALARAARDPMHSETALAAIGQLRDPRHLPLLAEIVDRPADAEQLDQAARALAGYLDAAAVEPLLQAAAKVQGSTRDECLAHLERIREYQDSKERWATRQVQARTREQVIAELVEQLGAKPDEVKVQAIRALATWEALEVMPRLIELTVSGSKSVAAAAREALERLNAPQKD